MIVSFHMTHTSAGITALTESIVSLEKNAERSMSSLSSVSEYLILKTCNRFEIYAVSTDDMSVEKEFERIAKTSMTHAGEEGWYTLKDEETARHIFRVTSGLDSLIIGEDQIQGQVKEAYSNAKKEGHVGNMMMSVFERALHTGKRIRSETGLNSGAVSVGSAAVEVAKRRMGGFGGKTIAVMGAGDMAELVAKSLSDLGASAVFISNRTYEHAKELAERINGTAVPYDDLPEMIRKADLLIVATSAPHVLITKKKVEEARHGINDKLLIMDISVPRNVSDDVSQIPDVDLATMDDIRAISEENIKKRRTDISAAEAIIEDELSKLDDEVRERKAKEVIGGIGRKVAGIRAEAIATAIARANNGSDINEVFDDFSNALVAKILATPYEKLKEASRKGQTEICDIAMDLFGVDKE